MLFQAQQRAACNAKHSIRQRLATRLMRLNDFCEGQHLHVNVAIEPRQMSLTTLIWEQKVVPLRLRLGRGSPAGPLPHLRVGQQAHAKTVRQTILP